MKVYNKTILFIILLLIETRVAVFSQQKVTQDSVSVLLKQSPNFTIYNDNYFLIGPALDKKVNSDNTDAKFQISFKERLTSAVLPFKTYLFLTYTQKSFWDIFKESSPFAETNYNPGLGLGKFIFRNNNIAGLFALTVEHESNGKDSIYSRSWNFVSFNYQMLVKNNLSMMFRAWIPFKSENKSLTGYIGYVQADVNWIIKKDKWIFDASVKKGTVGLRGSLQSSISFRPFKFSNQYLSLQWFEGYGESLISYQELTSKVRIGLMIKPSASFFH